MDKYRLVVVEEQCSGIGGMHGLEMDLRRKGSPLLYS